MERRIMIDGIRTQMFLAGEELASIGVCHRGRGESTVEVHLGV